MLTFKTSEHGKKLKPSDLTPGGFNHSFIADFRWNIQFCEKNQSSQLISYYIGRLASVNSLNFNK